MVIVSSQILVDSYEFITCHLTEETIVTVITVDIRKSVAIGSKFPESAVYQFFQVFCGQELRIFFFKFICIAEDGCFVIVLFKDLSCKKSCIPAAVLKQEK